MGLKLFFFIKILNSNPTIIDKFVQKIPIIILRNGEDFMYKTIYDTVVIMRDGTLGNFSQGIFTAYMECEFEEIKQKLIEYLVDKNRLPIIKFAENIEGHII